MVFHAQSDTQSDYLRATEIINFEHPIIQQLIDSLQIDTKSDVEKARIFYEFVRDEVSHSWDEQQTIVTVSASDVAEKRTGICYAKANLLAALLRHEGIPSGFCYQRLMLFDTPEQGYYLHAFNAIFLEKYARWIFVDARGNVFADFSMDEPSLAFTPNESLGEKTYKTIFTDPNERSIQTLQQATNALEMYTSALPDEL
ncbi:transglutaminase-like domain-containing protein [Kurthia senegalensis]|uniref:transglutaminase-like domain-containing protein n=1 Tax=Kurthia senegalensis TaxID=1033740 RepID=UPI000288C845|nr:transglutaminase family protein [Kurthia senegalensis]